MYIWSKYAYNLHCQIDRIFLEKYMKYNILNTVKWEIVTHYEISSKERGFL